MGKTGEQHPQQNTQKVLPQFNKTKLGRLRFGSPTSGTFDENFFRNYWIAILYLFINVALFVTGLVVLIKLDLYYAGWIIVGVWILLSVFGMTAVISFCYKRMNTLHHSGVEMTKQVSSSDVTKTPVVDPVMMRAVVNLVFHGQDDCPECKLLRHRDEYLRTRGPTTTIRANSETESQQHTSSFRHCDETNKRKGFINGAYNQSDTTAGIEQHSIPMDMREKQESRVVALVEKTSYARMTSSDEEEALCDETILKGSYNSNNNNDYVSEPSPDIRGQRFGYRDASVSHLPPPHDSTRRHKKRQISGRQDASKNRSTENRHRDVTMKKHRTSRKRKDEKSHSQHHNNDPFLNYCITNNLVQGSSNNTSYKTFVKEELTTAPSRGHENSNDDKLNAALGDIMKAYGQFYTSENDTKAGDLATG